MDKVTASTSATTTAVVPTVTPAKPLTTTKIDTVVKKSMRHGKCAKCAKFTYHFVVIPLAVAGGILAIWKEVSKYAPFQNFQNTLNLHFMNITKWGR